MGNAKEKIRKFLKADSPQAIAENIPVGAVTFLLSFPAIIFMIGMVVEFFKCLFFHNTYQSDIIWVNCDATIIGLVAIAAYFLKLRYSDNRHITLAFKNFTVICFLAMIAFMLLSTLRNGITDEVLFGDSYRKETLGSFLIYPTIYYFLSSLIDSETAKKRLINAFLIISFFIAALTLTHVIAAEYGFSRLASFTANLAPTTVIGIYQNINHYGYSLLIAITLSGAMFVSAEKTALRVSYLITSRQPVRQTIPALFLCWP